MRETGNRQTRRAKSSSWREGTTRRSQRASAHRLNSTRRKICESASPKLKPASTCRCLETGENRPFAERALLGDGPAEFCKDEYEYLRDILAAPVAVTTYPRPSCQ